MHKKHELPDMHKKHELAIPSQPSSSKRKGGNAGGSIIEWSSEARDDPNEGIAFGDMPVSCSCPHCGRSAITFIEYETSWVTWLLGFVIWFSLGWMAFWVLPLLWPAFKDVLHRCPHCLNVVARKSRISLPTFRSEVMTCKLGGCAVVLARKYVMIACGLFVVIFTVFILRSTMPLDTPREVHKGPTSMLSWEEFLSDCGPRSSLRNGPRSCPFEKYRHRTFNWQGEVRSIREGMDIFLLKTKSLVMVRMFPPRFQRRDGPDLALLFSDDLNWAVAEVNPGDWVEFEATMQAHGRSGDPEVMSLWHIRPVEKPLSMLSSVKNASLAAGGGGDSRQRTGHSSPAGVVPDKAAEGRKEPQRRSDEASAADTAAAAAVINSYSRASGAEATQAADSQGSDAAAAAVATKVAAQQEGHEKTEKVAVETDSAVAAASAAASADDGTAAIDAVASSAEEPRFAPAEVAEAAQPAESLPVAEETLPSAGDAAAADDASAGDGKVPGTV
mmetsp:Transcript_30355/g.66451  ORF Transcript_30355/g.66451 Transcript_30355/m.66451 type:complete len:501 (-) Transcript_30355:121-1623(-)